MLMVSEKLILVKLHVLEAGCTFLSHKAFVIGTGIRFLCHYFRGYLKPPFNVEARSKAGMTPEVSLTHL